MDRAWQKQDKGASRERRASAGQAGVLSGAAAEGRAVRPSTPQAPRCMRAAMKRALLPERTSSIVPPLEPASSASHRGCCSSAGGRGSRHSWWVRWDSRRTDGVQWGAADRVRGLLEPAHPKQRTHTCPLHLCQHTSPAAAVPAPTCGVLAAAAHAVLQQRLSERRNLLLQRAARGALGRRRLLPPRKLLRLVLSHLCRPRRGGAAAAAAAGVVIRPHTHTGC